MDILALLREDGGSFMRQPFGDGPLVSFVEHDESLLVVDRRVYDGNGAPSIAVTRIDVRSGDTLLTARLPYEARALEAAEADSAIRAVAGPMHEFMAAREPGLTLRALESRIADATYRPEYVPAVRELVVAEDGRILLEPFDQPEDEGEWWLLNRDAEPQGSIRAPSDLRILRVLGDDVWGVVTDELDVNYIVKYPLRPPS